MINNMNINNDLKYKYKSKDGITREGVHFYNILSIIFAILLVIIFITTINIFNNNLTTKIDESTNNILLNLEESEPVGIDSAIIDTNIINKKIETENSYYYQEVEKIKNKPKLSQRDRIILKFDSINTKLKNYKK